MEMNRIKEVLEEKGIKQTWLAEKLGKSYNMVNAYVQNRQQPRIEVLYEIAEILGVKLRQLLDVAKQRSNNSLQLNGRTCMSSELWILLSEYLQNTYNIKQRKEANLIPSKRVKFKPTAKYKSKFKASLGKPGNYWKLIYIRAKG